MSLTERALHSLGDELSHLSSSASKESVWVAAVVLFITTSLLLAFAYPAGSKLPVLNAPRSWGWKDQQQIRDNYRDNARKLIAEGFAKFNGAFSLFTNNGRTIMLSPEYIDAINAEPKLSFQKYINQDLLSKYETFKVFRGELPEGMFEEAVLKGLTRSLPKFTKNLSLEMTHSLDTTWGKQGEGWQTVTLGDDVLTWVAKLSTRIFIGDLCRNPEWLRLSVDYTVRVFGGISEVKQYPAFLHWYAERTLPTCRKAREDYQASKAILAPILAERNAEIAAAQREGRKPDLPDDSIEWFRNASKGRPYDDNEIQLSLAIAAIHTTSDLLTQAILNVASHPELIEPLREEALRVLRTHGLQKVALTEMRLLDSVFKETQRLKPISMAAMRRLALEDVTLPNGLKLRKGDRSAISSHKMWSEDEYADPETFDGFRFFNLRKQPGFENKSLLVSTSHHHLGFSHGRHACPGRWFAANEVKIALLHVLLKYDIAVEDPKMANRWYEYGENMMANKAARISVRQRQPEIDLDSLALEL